MRDHSPTPAAQTPAPTDDAGLLELCPYCGYGLRGLPIEHRCPECGHHVNRRWQVFGGVVMRRRKNAGHESMTILLAWPALILLVTLFAMNFVLPLSRLERLIMNVFLLSALALLGYAAFRRPRGFVAVGPEGVFVYRSARHQAMYAWERLGKARYDVFGKRMLLECDGDRIPLRAAHFFNMSTIEGDRCVRAINSYPRPAAR